MASLPLSIFENSEQPSQALQQQAWAAALVLITLVLVGSLLGRLLSLRTRRQMSRCGGGGDVHQDQGGLRP